MLKTLGLGLAILLISTSAQAGDCRTLQYYINSFPELAHPLVTGSFVWPMEAGEKIGSILHKSPNIQNHHADHYDFFVTTKGTFYYGVDEWGSYLPGVLITSMVKA